MTPEEIVKERNATHGDARLQFTTSQKLKSAMLQGLQQSGQRPDPLIIETLEMICVKISRVVCGNSREIDHYKDIQGYAQIVINDLKAQDPLPPEHPMPNVVKKKNIVDSLLDGTKQ